MPFAYFQRRTVSPSKTKEKKEKNAQKLSFSDERATANEINNLQNSVDNSDNSQSITQLQEKIDNNTGMPDELKEGVENLSGEDMSDVKVTYNSDKPAQIGANAYASGNDIHVAPGQEKSLPHEAWHVVQQKQNRVKPTIKTDSGELINDDPALEKEADVMGEKALQLKASNLNNLNSNPINNNVFQLDETEEPKKPDLKRQGAQKNIEVKPETEEPKKPDLKRQDAQKNIEVKKPDLKKQGAKKNVIENVRTLIKNTEFTPSVENTKHTEEYKQFKVNFNKWRTSPFGLSTISDEEVDKIWVKALEIIQKTQGKRIEGEWCDKEGKAIETDVVIAQNEITPEMIKQKGAAYFSHNFAGAAYKEMMKDFIPLRDEIMNAFKDSFDKADVFGFWSKNPAKKIGMDSEAMMLETSALGAFFDGINITGNYNMELWAGMSKHYAIAVASKIHKNKKYWGFLGPGAEGDGNNIYSTIEKPSFQFIAGLRGLPSGVIKWHACVPKVDKNGETQWEVPSDKYKEGKMKGVVEVGNDRKSMAEKATKTHNEDKETMKKRNQKKKEKMS